MARAKPTLSAGYAWHITHRRHKREFLLKFATDRRRWLRRLFESKKRYGLCILNYMVTSNHIHLLVFDRGEREVIPKSMQLTAGRTAQEYNDRGCERELFEMPATMPRQWKPMITSSSASSIWISTWCALVRSLTPPSGTAAAIMRSRHTVKSARFGVGPRQVSEIPGKNIGEWTLPNAKALF